MLRTPLFRSYTDPIFYIVLSKNTTYGPLFETVASFICFPPFFFKFTTCIILRSLQYSIQLRMNYGAILDGEFSNFLRLTPHKHPFPQLPFKGQCHEIFCQFFGLKDSTSAPYEQTKTVSRFFSFSRRYSTAKFENLLTLSLISRAVRIFFYDFHEQFINYSLGLLVLKSVGNFEISLLLTKI